jgi:hypothetical protein
MAKINPPYRLDPLQMIVNVNWGAYLLLVIFEWSDLIINNNSVAHPALFNTVKPVSVTITNNAPSGAELLNNLQTIPVPVDDLTQNEYIRTFIFDVSSLQSSVQFSLTDQADDTTDYVWGTGAPELPDGYTQLVVGTGISQDRSQPQTATGPWPSPVGISLYSKSIYFFDENDPRFPIKPKNPLNDPGPTSTTHFVATVLDTTPSTDDALYSFIGFHPAVIEGGTYSRVGLFRGGSLTLNVDKSTAGSTPVVWPSTPSMFQVSYVGGARFPGGSFDAAGYFVPNPPPDYNFGIYSVSPGTGFYKFGGPPVASNAYTGTYPTP